MGLFYGLIHTPYADSERFEPYLRFIAWTTGGILQGLGQDNTVVDTSISSSAYSVNIVRGCDAIEPTALLAAGVLAYPVSLWSKLGGILVGAVVLALVNLARLVSLFFVGVYWPSASDFMHEDLWQGAFVALAVCFWAMWVRWATRGQAEPGRAQA